MSHLESNSIAPVKWLPIFRMVILFRRPEDLMEKKITLMLECNVLSVWCDQLLISKFHINYTFQNRISKRSLLLLVNWKPIDHTHREDCLSHGTTIKLCIHVFLSQMYRLSSINWIYRWNIVEYLNVINMFFGCWFFFFYSFGVFDSSLEIC